MARYLLALVTALLCDGASSLLLPPRRFVARMPVSGLTSFNGMSGSGRTPPPMPLALWMASDESASEGQGGEKDNSNESRSSNSEQGGNPLFRKWSDLSNEARDDIVTTAASFLFALLVRLVLIEPRFIPSLSMFPTFDIGDQLLVDKISHITRGYKRRDVVVFNPPLTYIELTGNTEALIKRVVAVQGDTVEVKQGHVFINGVQQEEKYTNEDPDYILEPMTVPQGMLLVLGDNRNHSYDGHVWGFLPEENVIGRAVFKYWPPWRLGNVEGSD